MKRFSIARSSSRRLSNGLASKVSLSAPVIALLLLAGCSAEESPRPNLVLITVDRVAADRLGCFGGPAEQGLSACALAKGGTLFAWAASPGRGEASGVASILTGLPESEHGVADNGYEFLPDRFETIAEDLQEAGYSTAAFVTSPRVNTSRRLDQGFDFFDDRLSSPSRSQTTASQELPQKISDWIEVSPEPWFIWIHANRDAGLIELERLLSRLSQMLDAPQNVPGILFTSLRGERESENLGVEQTEERITWRSHRVPLIWRPPLTVAEQPPRVSRRLASLFDVAPTLRAAARFSDRRSPFEVASKEPIASKHPDSTGRDLAGLARRPTSRASEQERFVVLHVANSEGEVGLASGNHLYTRRSSSLDGSGHPVPMASLSAMKARFATIPVGDPIDPSGKPSARLEIGPWREDVLAADSPVPRLEFHLARRLARSRANETSTPKAEASHSSTSGALPATPATPASPEPKGSPE